MSRSKLKLPHFSVLSDAVAFIAGCLEAGDPADLLLAVRRAPQHVAHSADYRERFRTFIFLPLAEIHRCQDLRELYRDRAFPESGARFKLGGHMQELGCTHIDFVREEQGWLLEDIWICR